MIDVDNIINLLREAIEEEDWRIVEQVLEILNVEIEILLMSMKRMRT